MDQVRRQCAGWAGHLHHCGWVERGFRFFSCVQILRQCAKRLIDGVSLRTKSRFKFCDFCPGVGH